MHVTVVSMAGAAGAANRSNVSRLWQRQRQRQRLVAKRPSVNAVGEQN